MKNLQIPALAIAVLGAVNVAQAATFLNIGENSASGGFNANAIGVSFTVPAGGISVSDIQYFNVAAGNTLRIGLWDSAGGAAKYTTTVLNTSGVGGFTSVAPFAPLILGAGNYTLTAAGFLQPNSYGDSALGNGTPTYSASALATLNPADIFSSVATDPTTQNVGLIGNISVASARWKSVNFTYTPVPEPETYAMVAGAALVGFGLWRRRQAK